MTLRQKNSSFALNTIRGNAETNQSTFTSLGVCFQNQWAGNYGDTWRETDIDGTVRAPMMTLYFPLLDLVWEGCCILGNWAKTVFWPRLSEFSFFLVILILTNLENTAFMSIWGDEGLGGLVTKASKVISEMEQVSLIKILHAENKHVIYNK